jgi:sugar O-acyltransferase (sialic acid O-acetyltransferase NeuD family)
MTSTDASAHVVIVGAGDHGRVVLELLRACGARVRGFVEPKANGPHPVAMIHGAPIIGDLGEHGEWADAETQFVVALGDNRARRAAFERCIELGLAPLAAVHPTAHLLSGARIEPGATVCAGVIVRVGAWIGSNAIVNTAASIDHDGRVGAHASIAPGVHLAGRVSLGEGAFVGIGAAVREGVTIGEWAFVAGGAMVVRDVPADTRVAGVPARKMGE